MTDRVEIEFAAAIAELRERVAQLEAERTRERESAAKNISIWKASGIGVGFTFLVQFLRWLWNNHVK